MAESSSAAHESEIEQMKRKASGNWTLEGDAFLLGFMKTISNNLDVRCAKTTKSLNQMTIDLDRISVELGNTTNKLLFISNSKFVENRVQEEDETVVVKAKRTVEESPKPMESIEAIKIAAQNSLKMLDKCYEKVSFNLDSGDEESEDEDRNNNTVLRPKDPFAQQMPFLIGSREWKEKWHVGLVDSDVESDEEVDEGQYSESSQEESIRSLSSTSLPSNAPTYSESEGSIWGLQQQPQHQQPSKLFQPDDEDVVSNKSSAGIRSSNTDFMNNRGGVPVLPTAKARNVGAPPLAQAPPPSFVAAPARKPMGGGLFDDEEDDFGVVDRNANKKQPTAANPAPSTIFPQQRLPEPRKIVNLFDDLPPDDDEADWARPAPAVRQQPVTDDLFAEKAVKPKGDKVVPEKKSGGLFDDDYGFIPRPVEKPKSRITNLFDDEPDDDYFDAILSRNEAAKPKPEPKRSEPVKPNESKKKSEPAKVSTPKAEPPKVSTPKAESPKVAKKKFVSLFDDSPPSDDEFDNLFKPTKARDKPTSLFEEAPIATMSVNTQDVDKISIGSSDWEAPKPKPRTLVESGPVKKVQEPKEGDKKVVSAGKVGVEEKDEVSEVIKEVVDPVKQEAKSPAVSVERKSYVEDLPPEDDDFEVTPKAKLSPFMQQLMNKEPEMDEIFAQPPPLQKPEKSVYQSMPLFDDVPPDDEFGFGAPPRDSDDDFFDEKVPELPVKPPSSYLILDEPPADDFEVPEPAPKLEEKKPEDPPSVLKKIQQFSDSSEAEQPKEEKPNRPIPKKLNTADFKINMAALLPGARLPPKQPTLDVPAAEGIENDIEYTLRKNEKPAPVPEASTAPAVIQTNPSVLSSLGRNRAKMPMKRQPSTRRARQLSYQQSLADQEAGESTDEEVEKVEAPKSVAVSPKLTNFLAEDENDLFGEISKYPAVKSSVKITESKQKDMLEKAEPLKPVTVTPKLPVFLAEDENDLFAEISKHSAVKSSEKTAPKEPASTSVRQNKEVEKVAPPKPVAAAPKQPNSLKNDLFAEISKHPAVISSAVKSSEKTVPKQKGLASTSKTIHKRQDEPPVIKIAQKSATSAVKTTTVAAERPVSRVVLPQPPGTLFEDDLFSSPFQPGRTVAPKIVPTAPKVVPAKTKVAAPLFSSPDDDDLFGPPKVKKVVDTSKGAVPKNKKEADLFDTPDDDDFFSIPVKKVVAKPPEPVPQKAMPQKQPAQAVPRREEKKSASLFSDDSDDSDDLFGGGAKKPAQLKKTTVQPKKTQSKVLAKPKASSAKLFDDDDDDDDLFGGSKKSIAPSTARTVAPQPERKTSLKTTSAPAFDDPLADLLK